MGRLRDHFPSFFLLRAYGAIVLGILLIGLALDSLMGNFLESPNPDNASRLKGSFAYLQSQFQDHGNEVEAHFQRKQAALAQQIGFPLSLQHREDFADFPALSASLEDGGILSLYGGEGGEFLYQRLADSDYLLGIGPLPNPASRSTLEGLVITAYYLLVAVLIFVWIRPFYRDLNRLRDAASAFGKEDFSARVRLAEGSSIQPVAQSFNAMAERLQYLISSHQELTHAVSHELRTPLARFKFSLEILAKTQDEDKKRAYMENMKQDVRELENLVDEMLGYARLSEQNLSLNLVEVDMRVWMRDLLKPYRHERIHIDCSFSGLPTDANCRASLNPELMARAVHNILRNGLRYAHQQIHLNLQMDEQQACLKVCDDGPGIPEDKQQQIFEPFSRLDSSRDKQSGGHGLGLAIAARILKQHKGSIRVENVAPQGACFTLCWPRHLPLKTAPAA